MIKLTDLEIGAIYGGITMLKEHYCNMSEEKLNETLSGAKEEYINAINKLYSAFDILAYDGGSVHIDNK